MLTPHSILKQYWGYDDFRPMQLDIIEQVLGGQDTLALMPTGGGKSICFQVPALLLPGLTVVISPLIALMKDQVARLKSLNIAAEALYSGMSLREIDIILDNCAYGHTKLLYLSPERLQSELFSARIYKLNISMIAVDEAHCISQWGYDFRPSYLKIADLRQKLPKVPCLALTATATPQVVDDIMLKLRFPVTDRPYVEGSTPTIVPELKTKHLFQKSFIRENLSYSVLYEADKKAKLLDIVNRVSGSGIVYVRNRKLTRDIAKFLSQNRHAASYYHAGLSMEERTQRQEAWQAGKIRLMVCTNAFGMGIDKPDVRIVVHMDLPDNLEAYFQEAGRAGRDGLRAYAVMLYHEEDESSLQFQLKTSFPPIATIRKVYRALASYFGLASGGGEGATFEFLFDSFIERFKLPVIETHHAIKILESDGWISLSDRYYQPGMVMFLTDPQTVYDHQLKHPESERLLRLLLRSLEGGFNQLARINEDKLASFLKVSPDELRAQLNHLAAQKLIDYRPQTDLPLLTFLRERVPADHLSIDMKRYNFRRERFEQRMNAALKYAKTQDCRSNMLIKYFAEEPSSPCGKCDYCTGRHNPTSSQTDKVTYSKVIQDSLHKPQRMNIILEETEPYGQAKVKAILEELINEDKVVLDRDGYLHWNE